MEAGDRKRISKGPGALSTNAFTSKAEATQQLKTRPPTSSSENRKHPSPTSSSSSSPSPSSSWRLPKENLLWGSRGDALAPLPLFPACTKQPPPPLLPVSDSVSLVSVPLLVALAVVVVIAGETPAGFPRRPYSRCAALGRDFPGTIRFAPPRLPGGQGHGGGGPRSPARIGVDEIWLRMKGSVSERFRAALLLSGRELVRWWKLLSTGLEHWLWVPFPRGRAPPAAPGPRPPRPCRISSSRCCGRAGRPWKDPPPPSSPSSSSSSSSPIAWLTLKALRGEHSNDWAPVTYKALRHQNLPLLLLLCVLQQQHPPLTPLLPSPLCLPGDTSPSTLLSFGMAARHPTALGHLVLAVYVAAIDAPEPESWCWWLGRERARSEARDAIRVVEALMTAACGSGVSGRKKAWCSTHTFQNTLQQSRLAMENSSVSWWVLCCWGGQREGNGWVLVVQEVLPALGLVKVPDLSCVGEERGRGHIVLTQLEWDLKFVAEAATLTLTPEGIRPGQSGTRKRNGARERNERAKRRGETRGRNEGKTRERNEGRTKRRNNEAKRESETKRATRANEEGQSAKRRGRRESETREAKTKGRNERAGKHEGGETRGETKGAKTDRAKRRGEASEEQRRRDSRADLRGEGNPAGKASGRNRGAGERRARQDTNKPASRKRKSAKAATHARAREPGAGAGGAGPEAPRGAEEGGQTAATNGRAHANGGGEGTGSKERGPAQEKGGRGGPMGGGSGAGAEQEPAGDTRKPAEGAKTAQTRNHPRGARGPQEPGARRRNTKSGKAAAEAEGGGEKTNKAKEGPNKGTGKGRKGGRRKENKRYTGESAVERSSGQSPGKGKEKGKEDREKQKRGRKNEKRREEGKRGEEMRTEERGDIEGSEQLFHFNEHATFDPEERNTGGRFQVETMTPLISHPLNR
ncbi:hypothetical protein CRUP_003246 [Coryphaenoides rupestris]|nr:hypothetical protein CRUP_003246 [Coryphaenoides rupestris]